MQALTPRTDGKAAMLFNVQIMLVYNFKNEDFNFHEDKKKQLCTE